MRALSKAVRLDAAHCNGNSGQTCISHGGRDELLSASNVQLLNLIVNVVGLTTSTINVWTGLCNFH